MDRSRGGRILLTVSIALFFIILETRSQYQPVYSERDPSLAIPFCQDRDNGQCCPGRNDDWYCTHSGYHMLL